MILSNQVRCLTCKDEPFSAHRHDFTNCKCGAVTVDGGMDYLKRGYKEDSSYEEMSIVIDDNLYPKIVEAIEWSRDNNRNDLGMVCAIFRAFRDGGFELKSTKEKEG